MDPRPHRALLCYKRNARRHSIETGIGQKWLPSFTEEAAEYARLLLYLYGLLLVLSLLLDQPMGLAIAP